MFLLIIANPNPKSCRCPNDLDHDVLVDPFLEEMKFVWVPVKREPMLYANVFDLVIESIIAAT